MKKKIITGVLPIILIASLAAFVSMSSNSNPNCFDEFCPTSTLIDVDKQVEKVDHGIFLLGYNKKTKFADWVVYRVDSENLGGKHKERNWKKDPDLDESVALSPKDFSGANKAFAYDRGHQAPLASFSNSPLAYRTNFLSNITPQKAELNQGSWVRLEEAVRKLAKRTDKTIFVETGTNFDGNSMPKLPKASKPHVVPTGYWKLIVYKGANGEACISSFFFNQLTPRRAKMCDHQISLDALREKTQSHLEFFEDDMKIVPMGQAGCVEKICSQMNKVY